MRDQTHQPVEYEVPICFKEVVVIGNGPGGLAASYVLAGHTPIYNGLGHPDPMLSARLSTEVPKNDSIITTERIQFLAQGMEEFGGTSSVGTLFDSLLRPGSLSGLKRDSVLTWHRRNRPIDHVVLGDGPPGGIWQRLDPDLLTLSLNSWMELPGLRMSSEQRRTTAREVANYYTRYVKEKGLTKYQRDCRVISVKHLGKPVDSNARWEVVAVDKNGNQIIYRSRYCILACGSSVPKRLGIPGENCDNIVHEVASLESRLAEFKLNMNSRGERCRVLVVGAGLSAADAVLLARFRGCDVLHSFRTDDTFTGQMLPESLYPEYHKVREMMRAGGRGYPGYTSLPRSTVTSLSGNTAALLCGGKCTSVEFDLAAVLIGSSADLSFLHGFRGGLDLTDKENCGEINPKLNPVSVNPFTYEVRKLPGYGLYAIGSIVGDIYVRYITGGAVAAVAHIRQQAQNVT